jgi:hypothetical protein
MVCGDQILSESSYSYARVSPCAGLDLGLHVSLNCESARVILEAEGLPPCNVRRMSEQYLDPCTYLRSCRYELDASLRNVIVKQLSWFVHLQDAAVGLSPPSAECRQTNCRPGKPGFQLSGRSKWLQGPFLVGLQRSQDVDVSCLWRLIPLCGRRLAAKAEG